MLLVLEDPPPTRIARLSDRRKAGLDELHATLGAAFPDMLVHAGRAIAAETNGLALGNQRQICSLHGLLPAVEGAVAAIFVDSVRLARKQRYATSKAPRASSKVSATLCWHGAA